MEKRASRRIPFSLDATVATKGNIFNGYIENVSEDGIEYLMTAKIQSPADFTPSKIIYLDFEAPTGDIFNLKCMVKWYLEVIPHDRKLLLGMKIISPPSTYKKLVKNLNC
jgi:hypothetical protein